MDVLRAEAEDDERPKGNAESDPIKYNGNRITRSQKNKEQEKLISSVLFCLFLVLGWFLGVLRRGDLENLTHFDGKKWRHFDKEVNFSY